MKKIEGGYKVIVDSTLHPMEEKHYIEWIELIAGDEVITKFMEPSDKLEAVFMNDCKNVYAENIVIYMDFGLQNNLEKRGKYYVE